MSLPPWPHAALCCLLIPSEPLLLPAPSSCLNQGPFMLIPGAFPALWNVQAETELTSSSPVNFKPF